MFRGDEKVYVKGVTYGTFRPDPEGYAYPSRDQVDRDFAGMAANGVNAVRTYTVPPRWLLDLAQQHGLLVMVGFAWEHHVAFLDDRGRAASIEQRLREGVRACAGHPAVLCYSIGNEIPGPIVRWHGRRRVERFLRRLYDAAKAEDPGALVTYVNYPPTEYLDLSFVDFLCFNVYLEEQDRLEAYLARLHNLAGDRPLVMAEIGLDSRSNGDAAQAEVLRWQVRTAFGSGCAGAFVFAWTDEWYITHLDESGRGQGGSAIEDWDFGLVDRKRRPKAALTAVGEAFAAVPLEPETDWPRVSVVVCTYNGERTLGDCLEGLAELPYPDFEVIVVDDGSTDASAAIATQYGVRVISTENRGLSSARNTGMLAATGEIIAYVDDDARPDLHWLHYLVADFRRGSEVGMGGPNIAPPGDGSIADCVAAAPGGPIHVLLSDRRAEHIPGCNSAFRKHALEAVGGFDPRFRVAGDDVDLCWRLQERGWSIGFSPSAMVWHHRRNSVRTYWRQQKGYGKAEALLERKWPERYNAGGHLSWHGRLYGSGLLARLRGRERVYHGTWGSGLFQSLYQEPEGLVGDLRQMPEWYLVIALLGGLGALGALWAPLLVFLPMLALAVGAAAAQAILSAQRARFPSPLPTRAARLRARALTSLLFLLQPLARLIGRLRHGLTPWRQRGGAPPAMPLPRAETVWSEDWRAIDTWLGEVEQTLRASGAAVLRGGDFDSWDLEVRGGLLGWARLQAGIEEHGAGRQLVRFRIWPQLASAGTVLILLFAALSLAAAIDDSWAAAAILAGLGLLVGGRAVYDAGAATGELLTAVRAPIIGDDQAQRTLDPASAESG
ncbi:MAG: glycosyltransferase [Actinomycetota bacterium]|nr:glycosyltransferase [Actinomycetota bacterium]